jgi:hypothetical protein
VIVAVPLLEHVAFVVDVVGIDGAPNTGEIEKLAVAEAHDPFPAVTE